MNAPMMVEMDGHQYPGAGGRSRSGGPRELGGCTRELNGDADRGSSTAPPANRRISDKVGVEAAGSTDACGGR